MKFGIEEIRTIRNKNYEICKDMTDKEIISKTQKNADKFKELQKSLVLHKRDFS